MVELFRIIYGSRPFGFDEGTLASILMDARRLNARDGITGALICRADLYLQLLEGPRPVVEATFDRIARDDRHLNIVPFVRAPAPARMFGAWAMRDDPARSWMWTAREVDDGALDRATANEALAVFERLAEETVPA